MRKALKVILIILLVLIGIIGILIALTIFAGLKVLNSFLGLFGLSSSDIKWEKVTDDTPAIEEVIDDNVNVTVNIELPYTFDMEVGNTILAQADLPLSNNVMFADENGTIVDELQAVEGEHIITMLYNTENNTTAELVIKYIAEGARVEEEPEPVAEVDQETKYDWRHIDADGNYLPFDYVNPNEYSIDDSVIHSMSTANQTLIYEQKYDENNVPIYDQEQLSAYNVSYFVTSAEVFEDVQAVKTVEYDPEYVPTYVELFDKCKVPYGNEEGIRYSWVKHIVDGIIGDAYVIKFTDIRIDNNIYIVAQNIANEKTSTTRLGLAVTLPTMAQLAIMSDEVLNTQQELKDEATALYVKYLNPEEYTDEMLMQDLAYMQSWSICVVDVTQEEVLDQPEETVEDVIEQMQAPEGSYRAQHPEIYRWPKIDQVYSRWDWRITDTTQFTNTITDGSNIYPLDQSEGIFSFDTKGRRSQTSTEDDTEPSYTKTDFTYTSGGKTITCTGSTAMDATIQADIEDSDKYIIRYNGNKYEITMTNDKDLRVLEDTSISNLISAGIEIPEESLIVSQATEDGWTWYDVAYTDKAGMLVRRPYYATYKTATNEYLLVKASTMLERSSEDLKKIVANCISISN